MRATRLVSSKDGDGGNSPRLIASAASLPSAGVSGWLATRRLLRCDRVVTATWAEGERYRRLGVPGDRLTRIAPGIEAPPAPPDRESLLKQLGLPAHSRFIAVAGRLEPESGIKSAIWAFDMVRYDYPDLHLVILGDGPDREPLEDLGRAMMFDDFRVHFAGSRADLPALLALADVVWVTHERGGLEPVLEAMAAGRPVVAWNTSELAEVVEDGRTGLLVPFGERPQLAGKTYSLLADAAERTKLGDAGRARVAEHFSALHCVEQFTRLYDEVAG